MFVADAKVHTEGLGAAAAWLAAAAVVFAAAAATDLIDGWLARRSHNTSAFGAALDHSADKTLTAAALISLSITFLASDLVIASLILVLRDLVVAGLREGLALSRAALPVSAAGKAKTAAEMVGVILVLAAHAFALSGGGGAALMAMEISARGLVYAAAGLALWTLWTYGHAAVKSAP